MPAFIAPIGPPVENSQSGLRGLAWLTGALVSVSCYVFIEPAPYDVLVIASFGLLFAIGLRVPRAAAQPVALLMLFLVANFLAAVMAPDPSESVRSIVVRMFMIFSWLLFVSMLRIDVEKLLAAFFIGYLVAASLSVAWGILEYFGMIPSETWHGGGRAKGPFKDPNVYGPFLVPPAIWALHRMTAGTKMALLYLALFVYLVFGVLLSFSRGAWINIAISFSFYVSAAFVLSPSLRSRLNWIVGATVLMLASVVFVAIVVSNETVGQRFFQRAVISQDYDLEPGGRFDTQRKALMRIGQDPIGIGPGRSDEEFGLEPHNIYLHVFVESGWVGGISFFLLLGITLFRLLMLIRRPSPMRLETCLILGCLMGLLAQSFFIDSTHWRHLWLLLAAAWGLIVTRAGEYRVEPRFMSNRQ